MRALDSPPVPTIETERLRMRGHRLDDFAACTALWADPVVVRYIFGTPSTAQATWMRMLRYLGHWSLLGYGYWAVEEKASGLFAGEVGFADFKRELEPSIEGIPELGWVLMPEMHGKGYATEAVRAALAWADEHLETPRTVCLIAPENAQSIRVAAKGGFGEILRTTLNGEPTIMYERIRQPG